MKLKKLISDVQDMTSIQINVDGNEHKGRLRSFKEIEIYKEREIEKISISYIDMDLEEGLLIILKDENLQDKCFQSLVKSGENEKNTGCSGLVFDDEKKCEKCKYKKHKKKKVFRKSLQDGIKLVRESSATDEKTEYYNAGMIKGYIEALDLFNEIYKKEVTNER